MSKSVLLLFSGCILLAVASLLWSNLATNKSTLGSTTGTTTSSDESLVMSPVAVKNTKQSADVATAKQLEVALQSGNTQITKQLIESYQAMTLVKLNADELIVEMDALIAEAGLILPREPPVGLAPVPADINAQDTFNTQASDLATLPRNLPMQLSKDTP